MKAVQIIAPGLPLEPRELPTPEPGSHDVLVRIRAAGICRSDAHYRSGATPVGKLPLTPGHEIAGEVERTGAEVRTLEPGDRVCLHYMVTCGLCPNCLRGHEQFCVRGAMLGKNADGGFAEYVAVPERGVFALPDAVPYEHGAVLMCSSATSFHTLVKGRLRPGETVAVFGAGGLGISAIQLALAFGAGRVIAVDVVEAKLALARQFGALPVHARKTDPVEAIRRLTEGRGADVTLELVGLPETMDQAVRSLAVFGRAVLAGLTPKPFEVAGYRDLICREAEIIGSSDHLASEIPALLSCYQRGALKLEDVVTRTVPLDADAINGALDALEANSDDVRVVVKP